MVMEARFDKRQNSDELDFICKNIETTYLCIDKQLKITDVADGFSLVSGVNDDKGSFIGSSFVNLINHQCWRVIWHELQEALTGKTCELVLSNIFVNANDELQYKYKFVPFINADGQIELVFCFVSLLNLNNHNIRAGKECLEFLRELIWIQSHVVRAPIANLLGFTDLLVNKKDTGEIAELDFMLDVLFQEIKRLDLAVISMINRTSEEIKKIESNDNLTVIKDEIV